MAADRRQTGILLVHGITGSPAEMKPLVRKLTAEGFEVVCPPLAGHCSTLSELKQTRWQDWYKSLETALDDLRTRCETVFVSGLSMGALLALKLAADHPDLVAGVATLSATFFYDGWNVPRLRQRFLLPLVIYSPLRFFLSYHEPSPYGIKDDRIRTMIDAVYRGQCEGLPETYGYSEFPGVTIRETFRLIAAAKRKLTAIAAPLLIVHSTEDDMASLKNAAFLANSVSSTIVETFYVDDTYHVLTLDKRRDDVAARVAEFFVRLHGHSPTASEPQLPAMESA
ncbi:MAG TPA: alpha/beta fold hydrolase [Thermoanaerobaculia bacterium]|nr:alpha/beta fold hydrolase [Thermoanaerobaculia bacterium]